MALSVLLHEWWEHNTFSNMCIIKGHTVKVKGPWAEYAKFWHFVRRTSSPLPDILNYRQTFDYEKSGKYQNFCWWLIYCTVSLIYSHWTKYPARSNHFAGHLSNFAYSGPEKLSIDLFLRLFWIYSTPGDKDQIVHFPKMHCFLSPGDFRGPKSFHPHGHLTTETNESCMVPILIMSWGQTKTLT